MTISDPQEGMEDQRTHKFHGEVARVENGAVNE